jgi:hypothetical protein
MSSDPDAPGKKPAWLLAIYALIAFVVAAGLIAYMTPQKSKESSPAERTATDANR